MNYFAACFATRLQFKGDGVREEERNRENGRKDERKNKWERQCGRTKEEMQKRKEMRNNENEGGLKKTHGVE